VTLEVGVNVRIRSAGPGPGVTDRLALGITAWLSEVGVTVKVFGAAGGKLTVKDTVLFTLFMFTNCLGSGWLWKLSRALRAAEVRKSPAWPPRVPSGWSMSLTSVWACSRLLA